VDDLTIVEGIGEKIAELMNRNGIHTFTQWPPPARTVAGYSRGSRPVFPNGRSDHLPRQAQLAADRDGEACSN